MSKSYAYKSGKVGNLVYQRNRFGMICYPRFIPANPRTEKQVTVRNYLGTVSAYWRLLSEFERLLWAMEGKRQRSRRRMGRSAPLSGFNCFMRVNLRRLNRGGTLIETPEDGKLLMANAKFPGAIGKFPGANGKLARANGKVRGANDKSLMAEADHGRAEGAGTGVQRCSCGVAPVIHRRTYGILSLLPRCWKGVATVLERGMKGFSA